MIWLWALPVAWTVCGLVVAGVFHASGERPLPPFTADDYDQLWPEGWTICELPEHPGPIAVHSVRYQHKETSCP